MEDSIGISIVSHFDPERRGSSTSPSHVQEGGPCDPNSRMKVGIRWEQKGNKNGEGILSSLPRMNPIGSSPFFFRSSNLRSIVIEISPKREETKGRSNPFPIGYDPRCSPSPFLFPKGFRTNLDRIRVSISVSLQVGMDDGEKERGRILRFRTHGETMGCDPFPTSSSSRNQGLGKDRWVSQGSHRTNTRVSRERYETHARLSFARFASVLSLPASLPFEKKKSVEVGFAC